MKLAPRGIRSNSMQVIIDRVAPPALASVAPLARGRMLDIGCGRKPYREMFAPYVDEHAGVEHEATVHGTEAAEYLASAYSVPVPDASFDTVLCTAVLEHLEEPAVALVEARRVLRVGGVAIYTAPFMWPIHEAPRDFFRYTPHGLRQLFEDAGFDVEEIRPMCGFWASVGQLWVYYLAGFDHGWARRLNVIPAISVAIQHAALALDRINHVEEMSWMHLVVARARA